jgi:hypothetical protein
MHLLVSGVRCPRKLSLISLKQIEDAAKRDLSRGILFGLSRAIEFIQRLRLACSFLAAILRLDKAPGDSTPGFATGRTKPLTSGDER